MMIWKCQFVFNPNKTTLIGLVTVQRGFVNIFLLFLFLWIFSCCHQRVNNNNNKWPLLNKSIDWSSSKLQDTYVRWWSCQIWPRQSQTLDMFYSCLDRTRCNLGHEQSVFILTCHHVNIFLDLLWYCHSLHSILCPGIHYTTYCGTSDHNHSYSQGCFILPQIL